MPSAQDSQNSTPSNQSSPVNLSQELTHVTEEMYKKNAELFHTNKTLSILQKIDSIILGSVTDIVQVSQEVVDVIASEAEFKRVSIYIFNKQEGLTKLASSKGEGVDRAEFLVKRKFPSPKISLNNTSNLLLRVAVEGKPRVSINSLDVLVPDFTQEEASLIQQALNIKSIFVYPLIVRNETIGVITVCLGEEPNNISDYLGALINRLADVIGIAIDNALLYMQIQNANEKLKEIDKLKDEFVSLASHELRTPMTVIKSYIWLLIQGKTGELTAKQKEYLDRTYSSTDRLINMVNDMLNISRIESGRFTIEPKEIDLSALIQEVVAEMQPRAQEQELQLIYAPPQVALPHVNADPERIKQVLINLVGNSLKFTPKQGTITIFTQVENGYVVTHVKDTGRGIKQEDMEKLFKKFNMLGGNYLTKQTGQGTGLGLYLSKSLIELHKGRIWVESEGEYKGSMFSFSLPLGVNGSTPEQAASVAG